MPGILDPYTQRLFQIESGGNPNAVTGSNRGLGQFGPQEEQMYGINSGNRTDPDAQAAAVERERQHHTPILSAALGRDPTPGELYLMHQQGIAGGPALLTADVNTPAWKVIRPYYNSDAMAKLAITGNIPSNSPIKGLSPDQISAGAFTGLWKDKFEGGMQGGYTSPTQTASGSPPGLPVQAGDVPQQPMGAQAMGAQATPASGVSLFGGSPQNASQGTTGAAGANPMMTAALSLMGGDQSIKPMPWMTFQPLQRPQVNMASLQGLLPRQA